MRQIHYFLAGACLLVPGLLLVVASGIAQDGSDRHLWIGLFTASLAVALHTLLILFLVITGRVLREAMQARALGPEFLAELNVFFAEKQAYPLAGLAAAAIVAAGVLGFAARGFGISPYWHVALGVTAVLINLWALQQEYQALRSNQRLIDRAARELDAIDRELGELPEPPREPDPAQARKLGLTLTVAAWLPYLYWVLFEYRGDFSRVSVHPWLEISLFGVVLAWLGARALRGTHAADRGS